MAFNGLRSHQMALFDAASLRRHMTGNAVSSLSMEVAIVSTESGYSIHKPGHGRPNQVGEPLEAQSNPDSIDRD